MVSPSFSTVITILYFVIYEYVERFSDKVNFLVLVNQWDFCLDPFIFCEEW